MFKRSLVRPCMGGVAAVGLELPRRFWQMFILLGYIILYNSNRVRVKGGVCKDVQQA